MYAGRNIEFFRPRPCGGEKMATTANFDTYGY